MSISRLAIVIALCLFCTSALPVEQRELRFKVSLDGKEVGSQVYQVQEEDGHTEVVIRAEFKVKFLFVTVFKYLHENTEAWDGQCLAQINSATDSNGKNYAVSGARTEEYFIVNTGGATRRLPECIMTFAYWRSDFLQQGMLLNPQDGQYVEVQVSEPEPDERIVRGKPVEAVKYRLTSGKIDLLLWYSLEGDWLALESKTDGNRTLQYELM